MKILKGDLIARKILKDLEKKIRRRKTKPGLAVVLVGSNKASEIYVDLKQKAAGKVGMDFWLLKFKANDTEKDILQSIRQLNQDPNIYGIIVQLPLPQKFNTQKIINSVDPKKDADGFHPENIKKFLAGKEKIIPVFPQAILKLIEASQQKLAGKTGLVVANSELFGKVMVAAMKKKKIEAEYILFEKLKVESEKLKKADIVVTAIGRPEIIDARLLKKNAIVIDGGIAKRGKKILGDVDRRSLKNFSGFVSPVPGGVGPVTIACLLSNVCQASL